MFHIKINVIEVYNRLSDHLHAANIFYPPFTMYTPVRIGSKCVDVEILLNFEKKIFSYISERILKIAFWNYVSSLQSTHFTSLYFYRSSRFSQKPEPLIKNKNLFRQVNFSSVYCTHID